MAEEKLVAAGGGGGGGGGTPGEGGGDGAAADPVSAAVVKSLDAKLESIDDLIARLEIEEGEVSLVIGRVWRTVVIGVFAHPLGRLSKLEFCTTRRA